MQIAVVCVRETASNGRTNRTPCAVCCAGMPATASTPPVRISPINTPSA